MWIRWRRWRASMKRNLRGWAWYCCRRGSEVGGPKADVAYGKDVEPPSSSFQKFLWRNRLFLSLRVEDIETIASDGTFFFVVIEFPFSQTLTTLMKTLLLIRGLMKRWNERWQWNEGNSNCSSVIQGLELLPSALKTGSVWKRLLHDVRGIRCVFVNIQ